MNIFIDPRSTINYSSYYILGLYEYFGKNNVHFSSKYFRELTEIDMLMAFVIVDIHAVKKIIIDYRDQNDVIEPAYHWSNIYAKINLCQSTPDPENKIVNIPPGFAIKIWSIAETLFHLGVNFFKAAIFRHFGDKNIHLRPQRWGRNYLSLLKRQKLQDYTTQRKSPDGNYIFFVSTFWPGMVKTNTFRTQFILACMRNSDVKFEGGFFVSKKVTVIQDVPQQTLYSRFIPNHIYKKKIDQSFLVFNTPAVADCHGWKLGEFLAMGKAIISTPLANKLPVPIEHGKHVYFVNNEKEIEDAIKLLLNDQTFRRELEKNTKDYYEKYVSPVKVIERILYRWLQEKTAIA
jgi:glycosyltransferase involved in cell wall biosynthesis